MTSEKNSDLETSLIATIGDSSAIDTAAGLLEVGLDALLDEGVGRDVPVLGTLIGLFRTGAHVRDALFTRKVLGFLTNLSQITEEERTKFVNEMNSNPKERRKVTESLFLLLDRMDNLQKPEILARLFTLYVREVLTFAEFQELSSMLDRSFIDDLKHLRPERITREYPSAVATRLSACGILELESMPQIRYPNVPNKYVMTDSGALFSKILNGEVK